MISQADILAAAARVAGRVRHTPVITVDSGATGAVALKLEHLQHAGSFKPRGAFNRMLSADIPAAGVIAASGGNHGAAVAYAARALGVRAEIFVPLTTPEAKVARISGYGAMVIRVGEAYADALDASRQRLAATGAMDVHAYDHDDVLAGQGTVGMELETDAPDATHVLVAVGGGGLIGGIAAWYGGRARVIAVEPEACPALHNALAAGRPVPSPVGGVAADSLGARQAGDRMFAIAQAHVDRAVLVPDQAISDARTWLWERLRLVVEPGGATALAALLSGAWTPSAGARVAVVLCGANTDPAQLAG